MNNRCELHSAYEADYCPRCGTAAVIPKAGSRRWYADQLRMQLEAEARMHEAYLLKFPRSAAAKAKLAEIELELEKNERWANEPEEGGDA